MAAVKPATIDFVKKILDWNNYDVKLEEFQVEEQCTLANRKIRETGLRETYGIQIMAIVRNDVTMANPSPEEVFLPGDVVIAFGTAEGLGRLESCMGISCPMKPLKVNRPVVPGSAAEQGRVI
ncbi:cation:proton antiporter regulatory subunit [Desulforamulus profundi]|uniref:cation:proton antiporter regulatory subunit n=1 Tax=Desulforamulus profundi TaxID=1383067 RepID=UPI001EE58252|nr:TrkA C-terminal domain-containing protein [Desulforamulus profundi]